MPAEILHSFFSTSGGYDAHQGLNFVLEEYNRNIKRHVSGVANSVKWETVIKNYECLETMSENVNKLIGISEHKKQRIQIKNVTEERDFFKIENRKSSTKFSTTRVQKRNFKRF